jgi:hypothetical protein
MKKFWVLILLLASAPAAWCSQSVEGRIFTAEVPGEGWTVQSINDTTDALVSPDRSLVMTITKMPAGSMTLKNAAEQLSRAHGASSARRMEGAEEAWEYTGTVSGRLMYAQVFALADSFGYISVIGAHESETAVHVFNSIRLK